jgi:hypothetical protein
VAELLLVDLLHKVEVLVLDLDEGVISRSDLAVVEWVWVESTLGKTGRGVGPLRDDTRVKDINVVLIIAVKRGGMAFIDSLETSRPRHAILSFLLRSFVVLVEDWFKGSAEVIMLLSGRRGDSLADRLRSKLNTSWFLVCWVFETSRKVPAFFKLRACFSSFLDHCAFEVRTELTNSTVRGVLTCSTKGRFRLASEILADLRKTVLILPAEVSGDLTSLSNRSGFFFTHNVSFLKYGKDLSGRGHWVDLHITHHSLRTSLHYHICVV